MHIEYFIIPKSLLIEFKLNYPDLTDLTIVKSI